MALEQTVADLVTQTGALTTQVDASVQAAIAALQAGGGTPFDPTQLEADVAALQTTAASLQAQITALGGGGTPFDPTQLEADIAALQASVTSLTQQVAAAATPPELTQVIADVAAHQTEYLTLNQLVTEHINTSGPVFTDIENRLAALEAV